MESSSRLLMVLLFTFLKTTQLQDTINTYRTTTTTTTTGMILINLFEPKIQPNLPKNFQISAFFGYTHTTILFTCLYIYRHNIHHNKWVTHTHTLDPTLLLLYSCSCINRSSSLSVSCVTDITHYTRSDSDIHLSR